ncbi:Mechanosensitive ion channel-domain-containing protein [Lentinula aciculospora]|uniref:Mechanosensitive ion channel-domain-containing protein n=1 Tax=Lentinula aciculospora TaxID=153920 RepID=A0A9W9A4E3_9AGAR|nr:Mechanosensitive ion channel-domain-containing protein [Lentinula aciculospora]
MAMVDDKAKLGPMLKEHDYAPHAPPLTTMPSSTTTHTDEVHSDTDSTDTATNSEDEFNWDEDEDPSASRSHEKTKAKRGRAIYLAFMKLARPVRVFLLGALGAGILITPLIVVQLRFKSNPVRPQVHVWSLWLSIIWAAGCVTYLVVDAIPSLVIAFVVLFGGQVERLKIQLELTLAVSGWLKLALDISWAWISLSVLRSVYKPSGHYWVIVNRVMQALFSLGILLLAEKLCLQFIAINFHQKALADRLTENRLGLRALDRLSNAQPVVTGRKKAHIKRGHKSLGGSVDLNHAVNNENGSQVKEKQHHQNSRSAERKRRRKAMASIIVDQVSGAIGQVALKNSKFNRENEFGSLSSARRLARKLFSALGDKRDFLIVEDFEPYFRTTAEAHEAFHLFDKDGNGDISKREMREAVQRIYRERKDLVTSLKDAGSAVAKLDAVLIGLVLIILIFVCLLIFNPSDTIESLVPMATIVVGFSFIFGNSAATLFQSLLFIFSTHVFDVGDLVMIDDQYLFVKEFGLFSTVFRRVDGQEIIAPNSLLASSKLVHNIRRSGSMAETTELEVAYDTPLEVIEELRSRVIQYASDNSREWASAALNIDKMEYMNAIYLIVAVEHRPNWQDWGGRWTRRNAFMKFLKGVLEELDVKYMMPTQPVLLPSYAQATNNNVNPNSFNNSSTAVNRQPSSPSRMRIPQTRARTESVRSGRSARSTQEQQEMLGNAGTFSGSRGFLRAPGQGTLRSDLDSTF